MQIAFIGLGRLGFPCAVALATKGHSVHGYDRDRHLIAEYQRGWVTPFEPGLEEQYTGARRNMSFCGTVDEAVGKSDYIFVAVPTPHRPTHDGSFPYDGVPRNFDNTIIRDCLEEVGRAIAAHAGDGRYRTILVISTVTPGSMREELVPALEAAAGASVGDGYTVVYNPFFIGQSTVVRDFLNPEFVLLGCPGPISDAGESERRARELYATLHAQPVCPMTWTEAECVKLCYNTYLGLKVLFANTVMELSHRLPDCSCDVVNATLKLAKDRLISPKYMDGGMADGGPCHGRDQMAMSYTARQTGLAFNIFDTINHGRDAQTGWLADLIMGHRRERPVVLLGMAFKAGTNQLEGSPAMLLANILRQRGLFVQMHDPAIRPDAKIPDGPCLYFVSTRWSEYANWAFKPGDTVIDPWRMIKSVPEGVELVSVGAPKPAALIEAKASVSTSRPLAAAG
jgi:UDPglucose 6-dehydrogenase